jgi:hypothetical protein
MDSFTYASVLSACINFVDLEQCNQNHEKKTIRMGYKWDLLVNNSLITMYFKFRDIDEAC